MFVFYLFLLLLLLFAVLLFTVSLKVRFIFDTGGERMDMTFRWLGPFLAIRLFMRNYTPVLSVFLFHKRIYTKAMKPKKRKRNLLQLIQLVETKNVQVTTQYGFGNKFITGILNVVIIFLSQFIVIDEFEQVPDYLSYNDYILVKASAEINIASTMINFVKARKAKQY